jgi:hypothetical protein
MAGFRRLGSAATGDENRASRVVQQLLARGTSSSPVKPPWPREPTTASSASFDAVTSAGRRRRAAPHGGHRHSGVGTGGDHPARWGTSGAGTGKARVWGADLIVLGRSNLPGPGQPYVGSHTRQVLEFAERPVPVVPAPDASVARWQSSGLT